ncbi:MAG: sulfatase [Candidatus Sumerlaeota bacterium]
MKKPNIIHLSWHDLGRFLGCYGREPLRSPNVDRLAAEGVRLTNYWATSSICSPSRTSALTGRYCQTVGVAGLCHAPANYHLDAGVPHLSHILRDAGFSTALIGWQHETTHERVHNDLGFKEIYLNDPCPECEEVSGRAVEWLEEQARRQKDGDDQPFYLQLGFIEIHRSRGDYGQKPEDDEQLWIPPWLSDSPALRQELALQQANIRKADASVGVVLDAIDRLGLRENTLLVFTSDHGMGCVPRAKTSLYDGGIEIPLIVRWPDGGIGGGNSCDWYLSNVDFLPTLLDLVNVEKPEVLHGESFAGAFRKPESDGGREEIFANFVQSQRMIRTRTHKLIWNAQPKRVLVGHPVMETMEMQPGWPIWEFYDIHRDPHETTNITTQVPIDHAGAHQEAVNLQWEKVEHQPETEAELRRRLLQKLREIGDPIVDTIPLCDYDIRARESLKEAE